MYFTIVGMNHFYGKEFIEPGMQVKLVKEPENKVDNEAIRVEVEGLGRIGYVANSPYTTIGESFSAGRMYDKIPDGVIGTVKYKLPNGIFCVIEGIDLKDDDYDEEFYEHKAPKPSYDDDVFYNETDELKF